jgi:hypothetical protein
MTSAKFAVLFGALSLVFMGCPYESKYPVDDVSTAKVDKARTGIYEERSEEDYKYTIKADGNQYRIEKKKKSGEDEPTKYVGFVSNIGADVEYLNIYEETESSSSSDRKYYIYKLEAKDGDRMKLKGVTDNITEEFTSSAELKAYIKKYQDISFFFDKDEEKTFYKD